MHIRSTKEIGLKKLSPYKRRHENQQVKEKRERERDQGGKEGEREIRRLMYKFKVIKKTEKEERGER